jgi:glycosyltransferase involved in cell wall biosynthesis
VRVLHVINGLGTGGAERSLAELLPFFVESGISPVVACTHLRTAGVQRQVQDLGIEVHVLQGSSLPGRTSALARLVRRLRPAVVHTTIFESDVMGRLAAAGTGIPVLTSLVNTSYDAVRTLDPRVRPARLRWVKTIDAFTARHFTTWFHAISEAVKASAVAELRIPADRVTVITRGRDPRRMGEPGPDRRARARRHLGLGDADEVIVNVGRQEFQKGQEYLLEAADQVLRRRPAARFLIVGREGNATPELKTLHARLPTRDRISFLGHRDDVPELLCASDVFAFPSLFEGLGGALLEAMALGVPIVASRVPAVQEVLEDGMNGLLVEPRSASALADGVSTLLENAELRGAYARRARSAFVDRYTLDRIGARMVDLLYSVADMGREGRPRYREAPIGGATVA